MSKTNDDGEEEKAFNDTFKSNVEKMTYGFSRHELEVLGERAVQDGLNSGAYAHPGHKTYAFVSAWLADASFARQLDESIKRDLREAETLSIASEANRLAKEALASARSSAASARSQATWARWATIIAIIAAIIAAKDQISMLIASFL